jgi:hypothetical protein
MYFSTFLMMTIDHLFLYNKKTVLHEIWRQNENISNKVKSNSELHVSLFFQSILTVRLIHDIGTKSVSVKSGRGRSLSDACELMPQTGWQDALHFLHDEVQRSKQGAKKLHTERHDVRTHTTIPSGTIATRFLPEHVQVLYVYRCTITFQLRMYPSLLKLCAFQGSYCGLSLASNDS